MAIAQNRGYVQEVRYSGFAGRVYGCSRLNTSGTSNLVKTGYVQEVRYSGFAGAKTGYVKRQSKAMRNGLSGLFAESKSLALTVPERLN